MKYFTIFATLLLTGSVCHAGIIEYKAGKEFAPVSMENVAVKAGSALDLSGNIDAPAGKYGRLLPSSDGTIVTEKDPKRKIRLFGGNGLPKALWHDGTDEEFRRDAALFAAAFRRQGYNAYRMHGIDKIIMTGSKGDMNINPKFLDRWDYLISEMKKQGCYFQLVIFSFGLYEDPSKDAATFRNRRAHKLMLYAGREFERNRFKAAAKFLLNHVNPYTGLAWKDDPAIAIVEFYNEQYDGLCTLPFIKKTFPAEYKFFIGKWQEFLKKRYGKTAAAKRPPELRNGFDADMPGSNASPAFRLAWDDFRKALIVENNEFGTKVVRDLGYKGIVTNNTYPQSIFAAGSWESIQAVDGHNYFQHPSGWGGKGSIIRQKSDALSGAQLFRGLNGERLSGRPYLVGEFNHCFWNKFQHEMPLTFTAYAALNDFSSHMILCDPVWLKIPKMFLRANIFDVGRSPVQRAGEFFSSLYFLRGDVTPAPNRVDCAISYKWLTQKKLIDGAASGEQAFLGLLTNFSQRFVDLPLPAGMPKPPQAVLSVAPAAGGIVSTDGWYNTIGTDAPGSYSLADSVKQLRAKGILKKDNITDPANGIFQSETGEITMRRNEYLVKVVTPKSEAVTLLANRREKLSALTVKGVSVPALIGTAAVDGKELKESARMVLICATRMANHGQKMQADDETLIDLGWAPSLMQTCKFTAELQNSNSAKLRCYALRLDGERTREIPLKKSGNTVEISIDTVTLGKELTPFFELVAE